MLTLVGKLQKHFFTTLYVMGQHPGLDEPATQEKFNPVLLGDEK